MVAIVTGSGLGLNRGSGFVLGSRGSLGDASFGRYGENVTVNAATGNLLINRTDEILIGLGPDSSVGRSYNSLGAMNDDNGDNWRLNIQRKVAGLTGTVNTAGSTITRTDWDGSETVFTWDAGRSAYVSQEGAGAYDTLTYASGTNSWTWTDGDTRLTETYDNANGGRITASTDTDGNALAYAYDGSGRLSTVTTADGEVTALSWTGSNLTQLTTTKSGGATLTRTRYTYDASNRLSTVTTDLTPDDNSVSDGKTVVTTYTYDGTSDRVASISQTGGALLTIGYDGSNRVHTLTETASTGVTRVTTIDYSAGSTTVTDALGQVTTLTYDASKQLTQITLPPAQSGATAQTISYTYNGNGDVLTATDASGNVVTYQYDGNGNLTLQRDQAGNTITRTYGSKNELLTETSYVVPDPDGAGAGQPSAPQTTTYVYDAEDHLRFTITPEDQVTEYVYDTQGRQTNVINYNGTYSIASGTAESNLTSWVSGLSDKSDIRRVDTTYDFRGNIATVTTYTAATTAGVGDTAKTYTVATYTYDQAGNLLARQTTGVANTEVFTYDGLGRVLTAIDLNGGTTSTVFTDSSNQTVVTLANGLAKTSVYNYAGELISYAQSGTGFTTATSTYKYDALGRLRMATDETGRTSYYLYDAVNRKVADIAPDGAITEYVYDQSNRLIRTINYGSKLSGSQLASLVDVSGNPANVTLASIRPLTTPAPTVSAVSAAVAYNSTNNPVVLNITGSATSVAVPTGPSHGSVTITGTTITYTPTTGYSGSDSFQYTATNANGTSSTATASITVNAQPTTPPVPVTAASSQTVYAGSSNNAISLKLSGGAATGVTIITSPTHGTLSVSGISVTYTPTAGYTGSDSFQYKATNAGGTSATATVSLTVAAASGTEIVPTAFTGSSSYQMSYTGLTATNGMRDGVFNTLSSMYGTVNGTNTYIQADLGSTQTVNHIRIASAPLSAPGGWGAAYTNGAHIEYSTNGTTWTSGGTVSGVVDGSYSDFTLGVSARYVRLRMDSNYLGLGDFMVFSTTSSTTGEIVPTAFTGSTSYSFGYSGLTATNGMRDGVFNTTSSMYGTINGTDTYIRADLGSAQNIDHIRIASAPTSAPGGWGATYTNGAHIEYSTDGTTWTSAGTVSGVVDGSYSDFSLGGVSARYVRLRKDTGYLGLGDFKVYSASGTPTANAVSAAVSYGSSSNPVVLNITGTATSVAVTSGPAHGSVSISGTTITYTPTAGYSGSDSFQYTATNASGTSAAATASLTVNAAVVTLPVPTTAGSSQTVAGGSSNNPIALMLSGGAASSINITTNPTHGTLTVTGTSVVYTPTAGYSGGDSFQYTATNASGTSSAATVALTVSGSAPADQQSWRIYDTANRLIEVIEGNGAATVFAYDGQSNVISTTSYANLIASGSLAGFSAAPPTTLQLPTADATHDNVSRAFYDEDGRLIGALDGNGYLSQIVYNTHGEKTETIAFANLTTAGLRASGTFAQLLTSVGTNARDIHNRYFYDDSGQLKYTLDANLRPTEYVYDAAGNVLHQIEYAGPIGSTSTYTLAYVAAQITSTGLATNTGNRTSWSVYDAAGRVAYTINAEGGVIGYTYDNLGEVITQTAYAEAYVTSTDQSVTTMNSWASNSARATNTSNRVTRFIYDLAGRVAYRVDAEGYFDATHDKGYVTEYRYDDAGRLTLQIRYADLYSFSSSIDKAGMASLIGTIPSTAVQTSFSYDVDGRISDSYDGIGTRTHFVYDAQGRVTDATVAYGTADAATTHTTYDAAGHVASVTLAYGAPEASTTSYTYDGMGNVLGMTDGRGYTTVYSYDTMGNVLTVSRPIDATYTAVTTNTYDAFGNLISSTDPEGGITYYAYDLLNRLTWQVDAELYVTQTTYTIGDGIASVTHYAQQATAYGAAIVPTVASSSNADKLSIHNDETTSFTRDHLGRIISVIDAMGAHEDYILNAFGDRTQVTSKLGGVTTNVFDRRGLLTSETMAMTSVLSNGSNEATSVTNTYQYDARGNRTQMVEASGLAEARTTNYTYDKLDRLTQTTHDAIAVASSSSRDPSGSVTPTETVIYDLRGNVIETDDASGARTLFYYDDLNRQIAEISPVGTLLARTYDQNGNVLSVRTYGDLVTLPGTPGGNPPSPVNPANYRETTYTYDRSNELVTTTSSATLRTGAWNGTSYATTTGTISTTNYYDRNGNVVQQTDGLGNSIYTFYDKVGHKVAQVDQEKYLTVWTLDPDGNVKQETRSATKVAITVVADRPGQTATTVAALQSSAGTSSDDRTTTFTYDENGRRLSETRTGVTAWTLNPTTHQPVAASTSSVVAYTYNALGEVTRKTEATGDYTDYAYDAWGRQTSLASSTFTDYAGVTVQHLTYNYYNGLNNLTRTVENAVRITTYAYNAAGNMTSMVDPNGYTHYTAYDVAGRVVRQYVNRTKSDGTTMVWEGQTNRYDAAGRVIGQGASTWSGTAWSTPPEETQLAYDAYGEVTGKGINATSQETFSYDAGGRVWKSTAGDGTTRLFLYDAAGNQTLTIASSGAALPSGYSWSTITIDQAVNLLTNNGASTIGNVVVAGMVVTINVYDKRGSQTQVLSPKRETTAVGTYSSSPLSTSKTYNAFGDVTAETDARSNTTNFTYNTMGRVIQQLSPSVSYTAENGTISSARPTQTNYYDLSGRLIGVKDANNNVNTRSLLTGTGYEGTEALTLQEFHADGGVLTNSYDVFSDLRKTVNEVGKTENYVYDNMDNLTEQDHQSRPANSPGNTSASAVQLKDFYAYDVNGHQIKHWNSQLTSSVKDTTDYDAQGRITSTTDMGGITTSYSYSWSSTLVTSGLGTFGGWTKTTTNSAGLSETEKTDYFGRTVDKIDYGSHNYDYSFDLAGRISQMTNSAGETVTYSWYNTNLMASMASSYSATGYGSSITATYKYDNNGNRTYESDAATYTYTDYYLNTTYNVTTTYESATVTWDSNNRMTSLTDAGSGGAQPTINWEYDLNGNIRRMKSTFYSLDAQGNVVTSSSSTQDYWYKYDAMNRFVTTQGILVGTDSSGNQVLGDAARGTTGATVKRGLNGTDLAYDAAGERTSARTTKVSISYDPTFGLTMYNYYEQKEIYEYSADGFLGNVKTQYGSSTMTTFVPSDAPDVDPASGTITTRGVYALDAMGRITSDTEYQPDGTSLAYSRTVTYNNKTDVTQDVVTSVRSDGTWVNTTNYYYDSVGDGSGSYLGGVVKKASTSVTKNGVAQTGSTTTNSYVWWDGALQSSQSYVSGSTTNTSTFNYDDIGHLESVYIQDGRPRTVTFISDVNGQILQRDEADNNGSTGDPRDLHYYFDGMRVGDVSNNGTSNIDYVTAISVHQVAPGTGPFRNGQSYMISYADFDQSYDRINDYDYDSTSTRYTVQDGDTLESIALAQWGDASFWYLIADANGLSAGDTLVAGQTLRLPNKVHNVHNTSSVYRVYDPNEAIGDVSPTAATPAPPKHHSCGIFGQILLAVIAIAVTVVTYGALSETLGAIGAGAVAGAAGSIASQAVGLATGIQDKFSFKALAISTIGGAVGGGLGPDGFNTFGGLTDVSAINGAITQIAGNVITQGVSVATGLQHKFNWAGVAAAGVVGAISTWNPGLSPFEDGYLNTGVNRFVSGMAAAVAGAATRSLVSGTDFGDNLLAVLPDVIGSTVGGTLGDYAIDKYVVQSPRMSGSNSSAVGSSGVIETIIAHANGLKEDAINAVTSTIIQAEQSSVGQFGRQLVDKGETLINKGAAALGLGPIFDPVSNPYKQMFLTRIPPIETVVVTAPYYRGNLSMFYETGHRPGQEAEAAAKVSTGKKDPGGVSYGAYQLSSKRGIVQDFLKKDGAQWADKFDGLDPTISGGDFATEWQTIAKDTPDDFFDAQHQYIERTHYDPVVSDVLAATGVNIDDLTGAVQDVVWSMSVQHGKAAKLVTTAILNLQGKVSLSDPGYNEALVNQLYDVREQYVKDLKQPNLITRYQSERQDALKMLGK
jgi:YD repeat-containing protein